MNVTVAIFEPLAFAGGLHSTGPRAVVHVSAGAATPQSSTLVSIVDGVSQPNPAPLEIKTPLAGGRVEAVSYVPVPAGSTWSLQVALGSSVTPFGPVTLTPPALSATLGCGSTCAAGTQTTLTITAPRGVRPAVGSVSLAVDNAPVISNGSVTLNVENVAANTVSGALPIALPNAAGKPFVITGLVAGYPLTTISGLLQ